MMNAARNICGCTSPKALPVCRWSGPVGGPCVFEALAVMANQNRALSSFPDGEVDRTGGAGNERDEGRGLLQQ